MMTGLIILGILIIAGLIAWYFATAGSAGPIVDIGTFFVANYIYFAAFIFLIILGVIGIILAYKRKLEGKKLSTFFVIILALGAILVFGVPVIKAVQPGTYKADAIIVVSNPIGAPSKIASLSIENFEKVQLSYYTSFLYQPLGWFRDTVTIHLNIRCTKEGKQVYNEWYTKTTKVWEGQSVTETIKVYGLPPGAYCTAEAYLTGEDASATPYQISFTVPK